MSRPPSNYRIPRRGRRLRDSVLVTRLPVKVRSQSIKHLGSRFLVLLGGLLLFLGPSLALSWLRCAGLGSSQPKIQPRSSTPGFLAPLARPPSPPIARCSLPCVIPRCPDRNGTMELGLRETKKPFSRPPTIPRLRAGLGGWRIAHHVQAVQLGANAYLSSLLRVVVALTPPLRCNVGSGGTVLHWACASLFLASYSCS
jgi:hypothetical protein